MNTNDLLLRWATMTYDQIEEEIRQGKDLDSAARLLGADAVTEMQAVSFGPPAVAEREPVVLLPGIMGSMLSSIRGVTTSVWINPLIFLQGNAHFLRMSEDGTQDGCGEVDIVPTGLEILTYVQMGMRLNRETELYEFPYDWRRSLEYNADVLHDCLERWAGGSDRKFSLVAHSMGGLVSRTYIARHPQAAEKRVKQLIMMGTPNFGATNAIETLFTGNSLMDTVDKLNGQNGMREVVKSLPGVYNLLPAPQDVFPSGKTYAADWDIYDAASWGVPGISQTHLNGAKKTHVLLAKDDPQMPVIQIAGCNLETLITVKRPASVPSAAAAAVKLALNGSRVAEGAESGDGTVPLWSAVLPKAKVFYIEEKHGKLPANRKVQAAVLNLIHGKDSPLPADLPEPKGFFSFDIPVEPSPAELESKIRSGTATEEDLRQLYFAL